VRPTFIVLSSVVAGSGMIGCGGDHSGSGSDASKDDSRHVTDARPSDDRAMTTDSSPGLDAPRDTATGPSDAGADASPKPPCASMPDAIGTTNRTAAGNPYVAYVPASYDKTKRYDLVVALHGAGDKAANYLSVIWQGNADAQGFLVIAPEGTSPVYTGYTWDSSDEPLILAAIDDFYACYSVDPKKVVINGFSAGGIISYWIGLKDAQRFSGISIASADLGSAEAFNGGTLLPSPWKIPVSHFHGTQDMNFPIMYAITGMNQLIAAGHPFYWHPFDGGHETTPADALQMYLDLHTSTAP
jgi:poly(3-hydroxybutyrate) depolymerase